MHLRYKQYYHGTSVDCWFYSPYTYINKNNPCTGPEGFGKFRYSRHVKVVRLSVLRTGRLYLPKRIMAMKNSNDTVGNRPSCVEIQLHLLLISAVFTLYLLYLRESSSQYPLNKKLCRLQSRLGRNTIEYSPCLCPESNPSNL